MPFLAKTDPRPKPAGTVVRVTQSVAGADFSFMEGTVFRVINGPVPPELAQFSEPWGDADKAQDFDASAFAARYRPKAYTPRPPPLTERDILGRFKWSRDDLQVARLCGFPAGLPGVRARTGTWTETPTRTWQREEVDQWVDRLKRIARSLK